jgi:hypothetical protein
VSAAQVRQYLAKAREYADAANNELAAKRTIAATSLAVHAGINAADAVIGLRRGVRAAGPDHDQVLALLRLSGKDGSDLEKVLRRLLRMKTKAEYDPDDIPAPAAHQAVERAQRCVAIAGQVAQTR